tara:strand:- start:2481 stop:3626 length:1146 start_codon:yes stop_codon:yes gene_type:complete
MIFSDLQPLIWEKLSKINKNDRVGSAYTFSGQKGSAKEWGAIEFAKLLNCEGKIDGICNNCSSCKKFRVLQHPNLKIIVPLPVNPKANKDSDPLDSLTKENYEYLTESLDRKSNDPFYKISVPKARRITINSIRDLRRSIHLKTNSLGQKIILIFDAHLLSEGIGESANALLKILEEPPENTTLILVTDNKNALLSTVISRCQNIHFPNLSPHNVKSILIEKGINNQRAMEMAMIANCDVHLAIDLGENNDQNILEDLEQISKQLITVNVTGWREFINSLSMLAFRNPSQYKFKIYLLQLWFHHAYRIRMGGSSINGVESIEQSLCKFNEKYPNANLIEINKLLEDSIESLSRNFYTPLTLTNLLISIQTLLKGKQLEPVL